MSHLQQALILMFCFAGLIGLAYSWYFVLKASATKKFGWREWASIVAIGATSLAVVLRFVMPAFWGSDFGGQVRIAQEWTKGECSHLCRCSGCGPGGATAIGSADCTGILWDSAVLGDEHDSLT